MNPARWETPPRAPSVPVAGEVHLWRAMLDPDDRPSRETAVSLGLDAAELERFGQFRVPGAAARYVRGRGLLRRVLATTLDVPPERVELRLGPHGKPLLAHPRSAAEIHFNLAHSGSLAVVAVCASSPVGVDIEALAPVPDLAALVERVLHPAERVLVAAAAPARRVERFMQVWTRKEAFLKGLGVGLSGDLSTTSVADPRQPLHERGYVGQERSAGTDGWTVHDLHVREGFTGALAVRAPAIRIRGFEGG